jgi:hypothetical protein
MYILYPVGTSHAFNMRNDLGNLWVVGLSVLQACKVPASQGYDTSNAPTIDDSVTTKEALGLAYIMHAFPIYIIGRQEFSDPHIRYR